jgi:N-acetylneuraminate synthase
MNTIDLKKRTIGDGHPLYFIADLGANHNGNLNKAIELIELAKEAGADAAKFQNFQASKIVSDIGFKSLKTKLSHQTEWKKSVYEIYEDASISFEWTSKLKSKCDEIGIDYFSSPYDFESVDLIDPFVEIYKIGSGDITWFEIIEHIAKKGKPIILATGASEMNEVRSAMNIISSYTNNIVLMQCNTNYTVDFDKHKYVNLNVLKKYKNEFKNVILGLSDHTIGHATVLGSIALGARVIEKHFTDDNSNEGPDHKFAMNPKSWKKMVKLSNQLYESLGDGVKRVEDNEKQTIIVQRRCLRAKKNMDVNYIIKEDDLESLRPIPSDGIPPNEKQKIIGKKLLKKIKKGDHITKTHY